MSEINVGTMPEGNVVNPGDPTHEDQTKADPQQKKKVFKFYLQAEVELLKEIIIQRPFAVKYSKITDTWADIAKRCGGKYTGETARRHFNLMLNHFKKEEAASLRASGTEEEYNEKMKLLQDILDLINDCTIKKKQRASASKRDLDNRETGEAIRDAAMNGLSPTEPKKGRALNQTKPNNFNDRLLYLMESKQSTDADLRRKDQELQERRLALEEEKWKAEAEERKALHQAILKKI